MRTALVLGILLAFGLSSWASDEPVIEGWEEAVGMWKAEKKGAHGIGQGANALRWSGEAEESIEIEFSMVVSKWDGKLARAGLVWAADETGSHKNLRYMAVIVPDGKLLVKGEGQEGLPRRSFSCVVKKGRTIRFRARITKKGIEAIVGRTKANMAMPTTQIGHVLLYAYNADATFSKVKIKGK